MPESFTEGARRVLFFGRYEASQLGSTYIETEHLLLGILREDKGLADRLFGNHAAVVEWMRKQIQQHRPPGEHMATSVGPLSLGSNRALGYGSEESERLNHPHIGAVHLLLGLLREEEGYAAQLLRERGITLAAVREQARQSERQHADSLSVFADRIEQWLAASEAGRGIWTVQQEHIPNRRTHFAICVNHQPEQSVAGASPDPALRPPPLLCIEIIREDLFSHVRKLCDDLMAKGIGQVWLLDPELKRAYTATAADGLREVRGVALRSVNPPLELPLSSIFD